MHNQTLKIFFLVYFLEPLISENIFLFVKYFQLKIFSTENILDLKNVLHLTKHSLNIVQKWVR